MQPNLTQSPNNLWSCLLAAFFLLADDWKLAAIDSSLTPETSELARKGYSDEILIADAILNLNKILSRNIFTERQPKLSAAEVTAAIVHYVNTHPPAYTDNEAELTQLRALRESVLKERLPKGSFLRAFWAEEEDFSVSKEQEEESKPEKVWRLSYLKIELLVGLERNPPEPGAWISELSLTVVPIRLTYTGAAPIAAKGKK